MLTVLRLLNYLMQQDEQTVNRSKLRFACKRLFLNLIRLQNPRLINNKKKKKSTGERKSNKVEGKVMSNLHSTSTLFKRLKLSIKN